MNFKFEKTYIEGLVIITGKYFGDSRGYFGEFYHKDNFVDNGIKSNFIQDNHSKSSKGTIRGLHFQSKFAQDKLVSVIAGSVLDVAVDLRKESPTFGKYFSIELNEDNKKMFFIPNRFAHGFIALEDNTHLFYKVSEYFHAEYDTGIKWNDTTLNIDWKLDQYGINKPIISDKDSKLPLFNLEKNYFEE